LNESPLLVGRIDATSLAHERSVLERNPAAARGRFNIRDSITNWSFPLVRRSDSPRLLPSSTALAGPGELGTCFSRITEVTDLLDEAEMVRLR
jgi:hypothetical protein